jgi:hypothetical protein
LQVLLRELAVCIWGQDLRPGLPPTKPSAAVAAGFHDDTHAVFALARETLGTSTDAEVIRGVCRIASRRMVQLAFAVVMAREGVWATVLEEQAAAVGAAFPRWAEAARRAAEQGGGPWPMPVSSGSCWTRSAGGPRPHSTGRCRRRAMSTVESGDGGADELCRASCQALANEAVIQLLSGSKAIFVDRSRGGFKLVSGSGSWS